MGSSFSLALGGMEKMAHPLKNKFHPKAYRENIAEFELLVWCSWRLSRRATIVVTSDDCENKKEATRLLSKVTGETILSVICSRDSGDLALGISGGYELKIFCDHGRIAPSVPDNWELFAGARRIGSA